MTTLAITGVSGLLGRRLLERLGTDTAVDRIVGFDVREPAVRPRGLEFHRVDLVRAPLEALLAGVDVVVHLAFLTGARRHDNITGRTNSRVLQRILEAADANGVRSVVATSSAMVYGAWSDNPVPLTEDSPLRPNPGFAFAVQKAECERRLLVWREARADRRVVILRPVAVIGPGIDTWMARLVRAQLPIRVSDAAPPVQCVHADDVAGALHLAATGPLEGVYNVAPTGWIGGEEASQLRGDVWRPTVSPRRAVRLAEALSAVGFDGARPGLVPYIVHPWVVANDRLVGAGWRPQHSNEEVLVAGVRARWWQSLGSRQRQRLSLAASGAGAAAAVVAGVALFRRRRRSGVDGPRLQRDP